MSPIRLAQDGAQNTASLRLDAMDASADVEAVAVRPSLLPGAPFGEADRARTPNGMRSSPPALIHHSTADVDQASRSSGNAGDNNKSDSEAETIVLPGKDGHSPSKIRKSKSIKHEDKTDDEKIEYIPRESHRAGDDVAADRNRMDGDGGANDRTKRSERDADLKPSSSSNLGNGKLQRKRRKHGNESGSTSQKDDHHHTHGNSSDLSSARSSLSLSLSHPAASDSDSSRSPSPGASVRDKAKSVDRILPRRKQFASGSGDEGDIRRFKRQRSSGVEHKQSRDRLSTRNAEGNPRKRTRSVSPPSRAHRRSISTQLPSKSTHGLSHKKKRIPAPLQSTEYQSDDSSASANSHPRSSRLRHLAAPTTGDSAISPAKMVPPHKKHVNSSGQTLLARACASGKLDTVKQRLEARPEDLNEGDHAHNTPLHTASIDGHTDIVEFLLKSGCAVDPVNIARDTPLHDAIDNGHLDVVKLLLEAGANPRKANGKGEDPYDLVEDDTEVTDEMREVILAAKQKINERRYPEDDHMHDADSPASHSKDSPRHSPPVQYQDVSHVE